MNAATPPFLRAGDDVQSERGFAARFRAEDFDDAAAGNARAAQGDIQAHAAGVDSFDRLIIAVKLHQRAFAELLFDLLNGPREAESRAGSRGT